ncbi:hypothetical protein FACS1894167_12770 [Synergistales bacterium]|nr:hypothetical protein FACS1894167_12770 [Synergistales bacterium]
MTNLTETLTSEFRVRYDGDSIRSGRIDARTLADSLTAITDTIERGNKVVNGRNSEIAVKVSAGMLPGSFIIKMLLEIGEMASSDTVGGWANILTLIGIGGGVGVGKVISKPLISFMREAKNRRIVKRIAESDSRVR